MNALVLTLLHIGNQRPIQLIAVQWILLSIHVLMTSPAHGRKENFLSPD